MEKEFNYFVYEISGFEMKFLAGFNFLADADIFVSTMKDLFDTRQYFILNS